MYNTDIGVIMLTEILENTMAKAQKYEQMTKANRFVNVIGDAEIESMPQDYSVMRKKIDKYTKRGYRTFDSKNVSSECPDEDNFIVENPDEFVFNIEYSHSNLPFFKSICAKLNKPLSNIK